MASTVSEVALPHRASFHGDSLVVTGQSLQVFPKFLSGRTECRLVQLVSLAIENRGHYALSVDVQPDEYCSLHAAPHSRRQEAPRLRVPPHRAGLSMSTLRSCHRPRAPPIKVAVWTTLRRRVSLITPGSSPWVARTMPVQYRVLSLDLHDTVVWDTRAIVEAQYEVRWSLLGQALRMSGGSPIPSEDLRRARETFLSEMKSEGRRTASVPLATQVDRIRQILGAEYTGPVEQVVQHYAEGGLKEHPPVVNPEAQALVRYLNEVRFPVIMITDTNRSGSVWKSFLERGRRDAACPRYRLDGRWRL